MQRCNKIKNKQKSQFQPGYIDRIFEIHTNYEKDEKGDIPVIIKLEPEEKKKKRSIN